jgi:hypothetical protein
MRLASMVLPEPGGPILRGMWSPAQGSRRHAWRPAGRERLCSQDAVARVDEVDDSEQGANGIDLYATNHGGFFGVRSGDNHAGDLPSPGFDGDVESTANTAQTAVEREFSEEKAVEDFLLGEAAVGSDQAEGQRRIESGTFRIDVGGGQVDGDLRGRDVGAAVVRRGRGRGFRGRRRRASPRCGSGADRTRWRSSRLRPE